MKKAFSGQLGLKVVEAALVEEEVVEALDDEAVEAVEVETVDAVVVGTVAAGVLTTGFTAAAGALLVAVDWEACPD